MKKILIIIPNLSHGGTNRVLEDVVSLYDRGRYNICIVSIDGSPGHAYYYIFSQLCELELLSEIIPAYVNFLLNNKCANYVFFMLRRLFGIDLIEKKLLRISAKYIQESFSPDIVIAFQEGRSTSLVSYMNCKKIAWVHCDYRYYLKALYPVLKSEHNSYAVYDKIVCVSKYTSESFLSVFSNFREKVLYIYNPQNTDRILSLSKRLIDDRMFNNDTFTILSVGRFTEVKQFHLIPDIIQMMLLISNDLHFRWYIIGDGNDRLIKETRAKISNYNLDDKLILLGKRDNPYPYMKASNLYVCTSFSEAYPCVINEAKALGLPVVSNDFPSSREVLNDEFGVITSYEKLPEAICDMIKDKDGCYSCLGKCQWHANNLHIMEMIDSVILS